MAGGESDVLGSIEESGGAVFLEPPVREDGIKVFIQRHNLEG